MLCIYIVIAASLSAIQPSYSYNCQGNQFPTIDNITNTQRCCDLCQKGFFMVEPCTSLRDTKCAPCQDGYYNDKWSNDTYCKRCHQPCSSGKITTVSCTHTTNRECRCPEDRYWDTEYLYCTQCHQCGDGEREIVPCTERQDRQCEACRKGTFAQGNKCLPCKQCQVGEVVVRNCGAGGNTECKPLNNSVVSQPPTKQTTLTETVPATTRTKSVVSPTGVPRTSESAPIPTSNTASSLFIAVAISSVPFLIILAVLLIYCHRRQRPESNTKQPIDDNDTSTEELASQKNLYVTQDSLQKKPEVKVVDKGILWRDIPGHYVDEIANMMNPESLTDWSKLAGRLGFSQNQINNFRLDKSRATQDMLADWGTSDGATVYQLYKTLKSMKRDDAAQTLLPLVKDPLICSMV